MKTNRVQEAYNRALAGELSQRLTEYNHNHGPDGRFSSGSVSGGSSVSAGHGESSHRYTAKDLIGGSNVKRKQGGGRRFEKGGMLAGRTIKTKPGADPTDAVHTRGTFGDRGSVLQNQRAIEQNRTASARRRNAGRINHEDSANAFGRIRSARKNAPNDPWPQEQSEWARATLKDAKGKKWARTQRKATAGAASLKAPNLNTKGGYKFAKVARFRPRGRK